MHAAALDARGHAAELLGRALKVAEKLDNAEAQQRVQRRLNELPARSGQRLGSVQIGRIRRTRPRRARRPLPDAGRAARRHPRQPARANAVLEELEREPVDRVVCLGDVAVGPQPNETLERVQGLGCPVVMGNWDACSWAGSPIPDESAGGSWRSARGGPSSSPSRAAVHAAFSRC